jgi:hypothetical protein
MRRLKAGCETQRCSAANRKFPVEHSVRKSSNHLSSIEAPAFGFYRQSGPIPDILCKTH